MRTVKPLSVKQKRRLVVVSNRGPCSFKKVPGGSIQSIPSVGGLVSAVEPILISEGGAWIAWGGRYGEEGEVSGMSWPLPEGGPKYVFHEIMLTPRETELYYDGFANGCLWPLLHNFVDKAVFDEEQWQAYRRVNEKYAKVVLKKAGSQDLIWIHDYHLAVLPAMLRGRWPHARVSLFWHVPFPPADLFAVMPWAREYLSEMLAAELIAFHTETYRRNFLQAAEEIVGAKVDYLSGTVYMAGRTTRTAAVPIGINWYEIASLAGAPEVVQKASKIRRSAGGEFLLLGVERLDYTKGILERLKAISWLLENYPHYSDKVTFIQVVVPSRTDTPAYRELKREIEETVGRINGKFSNSYHVPVRYLFKSLSKSDLVAHYLAAHIALVTPVKDGLNLVAKEFIAAKTNDVGVLVLSPFAGAANQLKDALVVNPYNYRELAAKIVQGLAMPEAEKKRRLATLNKVVKEQDIYWWWEQLRQYWLEDMPAVQRFNLKQ